jgi:hypothetical protein
MILVHQDLLNQEESKDNPQEHLPMETTKNTQIEAISEGLLDQGHQAKRNPSYVTSNKNPSKKCPQILSTENPRKSSENHQKGK